MRLGMALVAAWLVVACAGGGTSTSAPVQTASPAASEPQANPTDSAPPEGRITAQGVNTAGLLGTYCWLGTCADVFDTPPAADLPAVEVADGAGLVFDVRGTGSLLRWSAGYRADDADDLTPLGEGGSDYDPDAASTPPPGLTTAEIDAPPAGDWVLIVQAFFVEGDAQYMWHVVVE